MPKKPELLCIRRHEISYCWNMETNKLEIYTRREATIKECPDDVAMELMELINKKRSRENEKAADPEKAL